MMVKSQYNSGYIITELEPVDDEDVTIDDVREADVPYIEVNRYECMGEITGEDEILTLSKFGIVSDIKIFAIKYV